MPINFFSINGAGSGGGSSSVNTANGLSGDGSVGTPVILGGTINQNTDIELPDNLNLHLGFAAQNLGLHLQRLSTGEMFAAIQGGNLAGDIFGAFYIDNTGTATMEGSNSAVDRSIQIDPTPITGGIIVHDTENKGLVGDMLFPLSGNPDQYVQAGHFPAAGLTGANNGLSVNSGNAQLGGAVSKATNIENDSFDLFIGDSGFVKSSIDLDNSSGIYGSVTIQQGSTTGAFFEINSGECLIEAYTPSHTASVHVNSGTGITVTDSSNIGLIGTALFPNSNPDQYAQYGNINANLVQSVFEDSSGQTTTQTIPAAYTPPVDSVIRVNAYGLYRLGTGSVTVTVVYTDVLSASVTATLGTFNSATPHTAFPATVLKVKGGTTVSVNFTVTGTITFDAGASIENLFA